MKATGILLLFLCSLSEGMGHGTTSAHMDIIGNVPGSKNLVIEIESYLYIIFIKLNPIRPG